jgi:hypothetical protein
VQKLVMSSCPAAVDIEEAYGEVAVVAEIMMQ